MEKSAKALTAVALAVVGAQVVAADSRPSILDPIGPAAVASGTGLTASDLVVGLDGTVPFDAKARGVRFAGDGDKNKERKGRNPGNRC